MLVSAQRQGKMLIIKRPSDIIIAKDIALLLGVRWVRSNHDVTFLLDNDDEATSFEQLVEEQIIAYYCSMQ